MGSSTLKRRIAALLAIGGGLIACIGIALIYPPAALIAAGSALVALGLFAEVDE